MKLSHLKNNERGVIIKIKGHGSFRKRIAEMGFVKGKEVTVIKNAPLRDPVEYSIMGYNISLRRSEARHIEVITIEEAKANKETVFEGIIDTEILKRSANKKSKIIKVALVGNPNAGKTTLFNFASGSREHVGNYAGVTVDAKIATFKQNDYTFDIIDLPGTYSMSAYTPEELYVRKYIVGEHPDIIVNVIDSSNLERNLFLTTQLIDMDLKVVIALNMYDELTDRGDHFDYKALGAMIGIPIIPTISSKGTGIKNLFDKIIDVYEDKDRTVRHVHINYGKNAENAITHIRNKIEKNKGLSDRISPRFIAIKLLEKDNGIRQALSKYPNADEIFKTADIEINNIKENLNEDSDSLITDSKYGFIAGALKETYTPSYNERHRRTEIIDTFITHKLWGYPIFIFFMWLMFQTTFTLGAYPVAWIESLVSVISENLANIIPDGTLKNLIIDGIISGVGGVIVFLPNILILFLFISFMEDTGYMARAAFIMDKIMHKIGLHGRSFIPLIMGFGCNVPAILSTRTIKNRNDRLLTILINPFMSCSARLPVYILILGTFFPENAGNMLLLIYSIGVVIAIFTAKIFKKILFKQQEAPFVLELPPYRIPTVKTTLKNMWGKAAEYLKKMGGIILVASILIWALEYYPQNVDYTKNFNYEIMKTEQDFNKKIITIANNDTTKIYTLITEKENTIATLQAEQQTEKSEQSYISRIGHAIQPAMQHLGFDWKLSVSLLAGIAGKEIVISTMGVLFHNKTQNASLENNLANDIKTHKHTYGPLRGRNVFSPLVAFTYVIFILIYFPCIAVIASVVKEVGWRWAVFMMLYTTALAWVVSLIIYQTGQYFV